MRGKLDSISPVLPLDMAYDGRGWTVNLIVLLVPSAGVAGSVTQACPKQT